MKFVAFSYFLATTMMAPFVQGKEQETDKTPRLPMNRTAAATTHQRQATWGHSWGNSLGPYYMPAEGEPHEGTWLQWPHNYGWDRFHVERYEQIWIDMTKALHTGERVHIIVYDWYNELDRVRNVLVKEGLDMNQIDFWEYPTDDVWVRDNGPIFVYDDDDNLMVEDWIFNGWGYKADYYFDDYIPIDVARDWPLPRVEVDMVLEGGSIEVDGKGTLMAKKSSILNRNRNPRLTQDDVEWYFETYLGATHFIWLEGTPGSDITDDHIDGTARFAPGNKIVTHRPSDMIDPTEHNVLTNAVNANGAPLGIVYLPVTDKVYDNGFKGKYINYYVGNEVVIVPTYGDVKDAEALRIVGDLYPDRQIVGIRMDELWKDGGAAHCVTQQQPMAVRRRD